MAFINSVNPFSLILAIGASFALWRLALAAPGGQRLHWLLAGLLSLLGALLGARIAYVLEHLNYFSQNAGQIAAFWQGGLSWIGAPAGALLMVPLIARLWQWNFWVLCDRLSVMLLPMSIAPWLACLLEGSAYGIALPQGTWWGMQALNESGVYVLRSPLQPLAAVSLLAFLGMVELLLQKSAKTGLRSSLLWLTFSVDMLLFTFMRADPAPSWLGLRIESWAALFYTLISLLSTISILEWIKKVPSLRWFKKRSISESKTP